MLCKNHVSACVNKESKFLIQNQNLECVDYSALEMLVFSIAKSSLVSALIFARLFVAFPHREAREARRGS